MFTSDTARNKAQDRRILIDLLFTLFIALFGGVYESFSHEVYSYFMIYAFAFPLVLGVLPLLVIRMTGAAYPNRVVVSAVRAGIASLTVGSLVTGALEIYGTTHPLTVVYWIAGGALLLFGAAVYGAALLRRASQRSAAASR